MQYDCVFEGGGAKGIVFVGACMEFVAAGHSYGRLLGTSAGAITATLLAAGYTPEEMLAALAEEENGHSVMAGFLGEPAPFTAADIKRSAVRKFLRELDLPLTPAFIEDTLDDAIANTMAANPHTRHLFAFVERGGWFGAEKFIAWMEHRLNSGTWQGSTRNFGGMTLEQLYAATQRELAVVTSDTTGGRMLVLNHRTAPHCPVVWAVRMSMSIPLLWNEVIWQPEWGPYLGKDIHGHALVDGGMLSNFPIELFISDEPQVTRLMGPKQNTAVLGLLIDSDLAVPDAPSRPDGTLPWPLADALQFATVRRLERLVSTCTSARDKMVLDEFERLVVRLPAKDYGTIEFDMTEPRRKALVAAGQAALQTYLAQPQPAAVPATPQMAAIMDNAQRKADKIALDILTP